MIDRFALGAQRPAFDTERETMNRHANVETMNVPTSGT
jgi:hypothetical protein